MRDAPILNGLSVDVEEWFQVGAFETVIDRADWPRLESRVEANTDAVLALFADAGVVALVSLVSPYRADRDRVREAHAADGVPFAEVFVDTPLEICEQRDPKGMYARARAGEITHFTGVDDPYEAPLRPDLLLRPEHGDAAAQAAAGTSTWATWPVACTPVSVRPATWTRGGSVRSTVARAVVSSAWTVRRPGWVAQPENAVPS